MSAVHVLRTHTLRDVPATLRAIAQEIEDGKYGQVNGLAIVLDAVGLHTFYMGEGEAGPQFMLMLELGQARMARDVLAIKDDEVL